MNLLFLCNQGENRSRTAKELFQGKVLHELRSAGFYSESCPATLETLEWADAIVVFEEVHVEKLKQEHPEIWFEKRIINLDILDVYNYQQEELKGLLESKMEEWWGLFE